MPERDATARALQALARVQGESLQLEIERPDETERNRPAVDFTATGPGRRVAIEHTRLGAFPEQEQLEAEVVRHFGPICADVEGQLPADASFALSVSAHVAPRVGRRDVDGMRQWVLETAPSLGPPPDHYADTPSSLTPARLYRQPIRPGPQLGLAIGTISDQLESARRQRIRRTLTLKLPKLENARQAQSATETLLVMESDDQQLSNTWDTAAAVRDCVGDLPLPTHLVLVERESVTPIVIDGCWQPIQPLFLPKYGDA